MYAHGIGLLIAAFDLQSGIQLHFAYSVMSSALSLMGTIIVKCKLYTYLES